MSNKQAKLRKGKDKQKKKRRNPTKSLLLKRGWWTKRKYKNGFLKRKTKAKKTKYEEKKHFKTGLWWAQNRQKTSKIAGNSLFGPLYKTQDKNTGNKKQNHQKAKKKTYQKKTFLHFGKQQLLGITDSKTPFRVQTQNGTFATKSAILGFPLCLLKPLFCSVWWLWMGTRKSDIFQKQIVATKMRTFFTFRTQIVFAYFSKQWQFYKKKHFSSEPPKNTIFLFFFLDSIFPFFHVFLFLFSNIKKTKTKSAHFFSKTLFWHPDKLPKKYFRTPTHYLCFF